jgi:hypothetical protein
MQSTVLFTKKLCPGGGGMSIFLSRKDSPEPDYVKVMPDKSDKFAEIRHFLNVHNTRQPRRNGARRRNQFLARLHRVPQPHGLVYAAPQAEVLARAAVFML